MHIPNAFATLLSSGAPLVAVASLLSNANALLSSVAVALLLSSAYASLSLMAFALRGYRRRHGPQSFLSIHRIAAKMFSRKPVFVRSHRYALGSRPTYFEITSVKDGWVCRGKRLWIRGHGRKKIN